MKNNRFAMIVLSAVVLAFVFAAVVPTNTAKAWCFLGAGDTCAPVTVPDCLTNPDDSDFRTPDNGAATCAADLADEVEAAGDDAVDAINTPTNTGFDRCLPMSHIDASGNNVQNDSWYCVWNANKY